MKTLLYLLPFTLSYSPSVLAQGLSTAFADVQVDGVVVGKPFAVNGPTGGGLVLRNLGEAPVRVRVDVLAPEVRDLRGGAGPVPETGWVQVDPDHLEIPAHGEGRCRVMIRVPAQKAYRHQYYQATLWSRSEPVNNQGMGFGAGLLSRLRFKTR